MVLAFYRHMAARMVPELLTEKHRPTQENDLIPGRRSAGVRSIVPENASGTIRKPIRTA